MALDDLNEHWRAPVPWCSALLGDGTPAAGPSTRGSTGRDADVVTLTEKQEELCRQSQWDFSDLRAVFINCTLKRSPELSHTQGLIDISSEIMGRQGVAVEEVRAVDHDIATGVW